MSSPHIQRLCLERLVLRVTCLVQKTALSTGAGIGGQNGGSGTTAPPSGHPPHNCPTDKHVQQHVKGIHVLLRNQSTTIGPSWVSA